MADVSLTWIEPGRLAACSYPSGDEAYQVLTSAGITLIVNLDVRAHDDDRLAAFGMTQLHVPVAEFTPPTQDQAQRAVDAIGDVLDAGGCVLVHCAGGLGRTGTLVACYLAATGLSPDDAIARVRELRPGSVETDAQAESVRTFVRARQGDSSSV